MDSREGGLRDWVEEQLGILGRARPGTMEFSSVAGDASFRRYFRAVRSGHQFIAMDAPPEHEDSAPFVAIARAWFAQGINVPEVYAEDLEQGFMLLADFGNTQYADVLDEANADVYYGRAMDSLLQIMTSSEPDDWRLPPYDADLLQREMLLFVDWLSGQLLGLDLGSEAARGLQPCFDMLVENALEQPQVPVHRDYHSRNLMVLNGGAPGIIDFQDAVRGPVTYDLVSLLRDCYQSWPPEMVQAWALAFAARAREAGLHDADNDQFMRWFDWMGVQRHLKASGIFVRLWLRDGKRGYLADIPRTLNYILEVARGYPELEPLECWIIEQMLPRMASSDEFGDSEFLPIWRQM